MSVNNMTFEQAATVLSDIVSQASAQSLPAPVNYADFVSVAQTALKTGYDPLATSISQVLSKTVFSIRPYYAKLRGLFTSPERYGNHVRKINYVDGALEDDERFSLVDGQSVDHYKVNKPSVIQTNFYGAFQYQRHTTVYKDQLDNAFKGPAEFSEFITGQMQNIYDQLEQVRENYARMALNNMILAKVGTGNNVIYLIDEYNAYAGTSLTKANIFDPANFVPFVKWMYGFIQSLAGLMSERSYMYHMVIENKPVQRHTPADRMKAYINTQMLNNIDASVLSGIFHDERLKMVDYEPINFWQSIYEPYKISGTCTSMDYEGTLISLPQAEIDNVFGILFDEEAIGVTLVNQWSATTPLNAAGGFSNTYWHETVRTWNDFSENAVVLVLDNAPTEP